MIEITRNYTQGFVWFTVTVIIGFAVLWALVHPLQTALICGAGWLLSVVVVAVMMARAPYGKEISNVGFVRTDRDGRPLHD